MVWGSVSALCKGISISSCDGGMKWEMDRRFGALAAVFWFLLHSVWVPKESSQKAKLDIVLLAAGGGLIENDTGVFFDTHQTLLVCFIL